MASRQTIARLSDRIEALAEAPLRENRSAPKAMTDDVNAAEIGELYRKARECLGTPVIEPDEIIPPSETKQGSVTPIRLFSGKLSGSRNGRNTRYSNLGRSLDATVCHWCDQKFAPGQMRYPILTDTSIGWQAVSVCMECFKEASPDETGETINPNWPAWAPKPPRRWASPRREMQCPGCGEPIFTAPDFRSPRLLVCSARCYQRVYRKRRRGVGSAIEWKLENRPARCEACKQPIKQHRRDARYCSNRCRQWHYRQRKRAVAP